MCDSWEDHFKWLFLWRAPQTSQISVSTGNVVGSVECVTACFLIANVSDYEASLKKEGGIPDGPVLESLLAGETLDKKVETKEEESMSECQVRLCSAPNCSLRPILLVVCPVDLFLSVCVTLCVGDSLSVSAFVSHCFGGGTDSRSSNHFLLALHVCVCLWLFGTVLQPNVCFTVISFTRR